MCGIVGYVGPRPAQPILIEGLERLEYRGYDSAGVAVINNGALGVTRNAGRIAGLVEALDAVGGYEGTSGIGHTRWATHGPPTTGNAHPHLDCSTDVAVVHNGIIENYQELKDELIASGHVFSSDTDTEVLAHMVESMADHSLGDAVREVMKRTDGALAIGVMRRSDPRLVVGARRGSPLIVGLGEGENYLASDISAILSHTRSMGVIEDDRVVEVTEDSVMLTDLDGAQLPLAVREIEWDLESAEKEGYDDFMLKEIFEQPRALRDTLAGRINDRGEVVLDIGLTPQQARAFDKVFVVACGTSYHAGLMGKYAIERWTRIPVEIDIASEFRYRDPVLDSKTLVIGMSQSGETADTLAALQYARAQGAYIMSTTNVVESSMARESHAVLYTRAGPEIGVASTKTFVCQLVTMQLLALYLAHHRGSLDDATIQTETTAMRRLPEQTETLLQSADAFAEIGRRYAETRDVFFLGRGVSFPIALEGALKLKEIAYARAEGYPAGEMKHGPIALIEDGVLVVGVATNSHLHLKTMSNMEEMKARGGELLMVVSEGDQEASRIADHIMTVPAAPELVSPVLSVVPLQIFSYAIAKARGLDVDKPRNLAKTVTVE